jgi:hypothetical protein
MAKQDWNLERTKLREKFTIGEITKSTREELEFYLIVLSNSRSPTSSGVPDHFEETKSFTNVVRHLLQVRIGQELHEQSQKVSVKSLRVSILAIVIAAIAAVFAGLLVVVDYKKSETTNVQPDVEKSSLAPQPAITQSPQLKSPLTNALSQLMTNPSAASQSTSTNN